MTVPGPWVTRWFHEGPALFSLDLQPPTPSSLLPCLGEENAFVSLCCYSQSPPTIGLKQYKFGIFCFWSSVLLSGSYMAKTQALTGICSPEASKQQPFPCSSDVQTVPRASAPGPFPRPPRQHTAISSSSPDLASPAPALAQKAACGDNPG